MYLPFFLFLFSFFSLLSNHSFSSIINIMSNKVYCVGVGMSRFIKPRGEIDYPGKLTCDGRSLCSHCCPP